MTDTDTQINTPWAKLRIFEAFAGIGAQSMALKRLGACYEVVGISEWMVDAIICYDAIHHAGYPPIDVPSYEEQIEYLSQFEFSRDSARKTNLKQIERDVIEKLYVANIRCNNCGSINQLKGETMPDTDLLIYSFPCQDLSTGGNGGGMAKDSGTRSSLLWEIERVLVELKDLNKLPTYLLMENVTTIFCERFMPDLKKFLAFLESIGYKSDEPMKLNALDFGVPQDRQRAFIASRLGGGLLDISKKVESAKKERVFDATQFLRLDYKNKHYKEEADIAQLNATPSRKVMWNINGKAAGANTIVRTITCNMDRTHTAALFKYTGILGDTFRRLTIREAFLFMGFTEEEYERSKPLEFSYRRMNKLIGNSIVVNVLQEIFRAIYAGQYGIKEFPENITQ